MYTLPISLITLSVFFGIIVFTLENKKNSFKNIKINKKKLKKKDDKKIKIFNIMYSMPVVKYLLNRCLNSINNSADIKERIKKTSVDIVIKSLIIFFASSIIISPFVNNFRVFITAIIAIMFITISSIDYFSGKVKTKLLTHLVDFLDILRNKYFECGNRVDDALAETIQSLDIDRHSDIIDEGETLLETIEHPDSDLALRDYYQVAPNKYFILLAGLLFICKENGDLIDEHGSRFARALSDLGSELKEEIKLRDRLNFSLKSLNLIAIIPLFVISPLRFWASESFYPLKKFYDGSLGFLTEFIVLISVILSFIGISKVQSFKEALKEKNIDYSMQNFYKKFKKIIDFIKPRKHSKRYKKVLMQKESALDFSSIEIFYSKKLTFLLFTFILCFLISIYSSHIAKTAILENPTLPEGYLGGEVSKTDLKLAKERSLMDKKMILLLDKGENSKNLIKLLENEYGLLGDRRKKAIERVIKKYKNYESSKLNYKDIIFIYIASVLSFFIPNLLLIIRKRLIKIDSMNEISKFQLICSLMMHIKQMNLSTLLEWLERFSVIYKKPLQDAIMDYDSGAEEALIKLKNCSKNDEFRKLVEHMLSSVNSISISRAFEDLAIEKNYYKEKRETIYERIVDKKIHIGRIIGFIPTYSVILIYFMFPLIYSSMEEIDLYFKMFTS